MLSGYGLLELTGHRADEHKNITSSDLENRSEQLYSDLEQTVLGIIMSGKRVVIISDNPELLDDPKICRYSTHKAEECDVKVERSIVNERLKVINSIYDRLKSKITDMTILNPASAFCDSKYCYASGNGSIWYQSTDHLTPSGARRLFNYIKLDNVQQMAKREIH